MGCDPPTMAVSSLCGAPGRPHPAPKPMQQGWYLPSFCTSSPKQGLVCMAGRGLLRALLAPWVPCPQIGGCGLRAALERPRGDCREAEELRRLLGCLCSSLFVPSAVCRTCPPTDFGLFAVSTFLPIAFPGGWARGLLPGCTTQPCMVLGHWLPVGGKKTEGSQQGDSRVLYNPATCFPWPFSSSWAPHGCCGLCGRILLRCCFPMEGKLPSQPV